MNEHFDSCNHRNPFFARHADQWCLYWIVDEIENQARIDFLRFENMPGFHALHADRRRIHYHVEVRLGHLITAECLGLGLASQLLCSLWSSVQDENFRALIPQTEDSRPPCSARSHYQDLGIFQLETFFQ